MKLTRFKAPNTYLIIFSLIVLVAIFTWFLPGGKYQRAEMDGREVLVPGSFEYVESNPQGIGAILMAPIRGFMDAALIIGFVLITGGTFGVLTRTKAVDAAIKAIAKAHSRSKVVRLLLIPILMVIFSLMGAIFGFSEEVIPFILIFVPLALILGYDTITGIAIPFVGAGAGFAGAFFNPFTVGIAQGIAELPLFSGLEYRMVCWVIITAVCTAFVMVYAAKIKKNPQKSATYDKDQVKRQNLEITDIENFAGMSRRQVTVLVIFALSILGLIVGVLKFHWYI
ncbi:YfcC family protein, partial [bacterium]|nr:YfcC family protein [bacterium]